MLHPVMQRVFNPENPNLYFVQQESHKVEIRLVAAGVSSIEAGKYTNGVLIRTNKPASKEELPAGTIDIYERLMESINNYRSSLSQRRDH